MCWGVFLNSSRKPMKGELFDVPGKVDTIPKRTSVWRKGSTCWKHCSEANRDKGCSRNTIPASLWYCPEKLFCP